MAIAYFTRATALNAIEQMIQRSDDTNVFRNVRLDVLESSTDCAHLGHFMTAIIGGIEKSRQQTIADRIKKTRRRPADSWLDKNLAPFRRLTEIVNAYRTVLPHGCK